MLFHKFKIISSNLFNIELIQDQTSFEQWVTSVLSTPPICMALDTEFERRTTHRPILSLVQVCIGDHVTLIDALAVDIKAFESILNVPHIVKIMHSAAQDLEIFDYIFQERMVSFFDTQIAATLCGEGEGLGYQKIIKQLLDIELDKTEQKGDWMKRPLHDNQQRYAALDVFYLPKLYETLASKLRTLNRSAWLYPIQQQIYQPRTDALDQHKAILKFIPLPKMSLSARIFLFAMVIWREKIADTTNIHRKWILSDTALLHMCHHILELDLSSYTFFEKNPEHQTDVQAILDEILSLSTNEQKETFALLKARYIVKKLPATQQRKIEDIRRYINEIAQRENIPPHYIASKRDVDVWSKSGVIHLEESDWRKDIGLHEFVPKIRTPGIESSKLRSDPPIL